MRSRPAIFGCCFHGVLVTVWLAAGIAPGAELTPSTPGQAIEFSEPRQDLLVTNLNQLNRQIDGAQNLERTPPRAESLRPSLAPPYSILTPPGGVSGVIINKRARRPLDTFSSTELTTPEDAVRELYLDQLLKSSGLDRSGQGQDMRRPGTSALEGPSVESLYERMLGGGPEASSLRDYGWLNSSRAGQDQSGYTTIEQSRASRADELLPASGYSEVSPITGMSSAGGGSDDLADAFRSRNVTRPGVADTGTFLANQAAQQDRMKRFQDLLNGIYELQPAAGPKSAPLPENPWMTGPAASASVPEAASPLARGPNTADAYPYLAPPSAPTAPTPPTAVPDSSTGITQPPARTPPPRPIFSVERRPF